MIIVGFTLWILKSRFCFKLTSLYSRTFIYFAAAFYACFYCFIFSLTTFTLMWKGIQLLKPVPPHTLYKRPTLTTLLYFLLLVQLWWAVRSACEGKAQVREPGAQVLTITLAHCRLRWSSSAQILKPDSYFWVLICRRGKTPSCCLLLVPHFLDR